MRMIVSALPIAVLLTGCASLSDRQMSRFDSMSCGQLSVALEYEREAEHEASLDATLGHLSSLSYEGAAKTDAQLDALSGDLDADERRLAMDYIRDREDYLDC